MAAIIQSTIGALGYRDKKGVYQREPDCYESIRDLITFLRSDHNKAFRKICGDQNIIKTDLVPIMSASNTPDQLFDVALRLAINLCQPVALVYRGEMPEERDEWKLYIELEGNLSRAKLGFANQAFMTVICEKIARYFSLDWTDRMEAGKMLVERMMLLLKYALAINSGENDKQRTSEDMNTHDRILVAFLDSGLGDQLIEIGCNKYERDFHLHVLEIFALLLMEHKPKDVYLVGTTKQKEINEQLLKKSVEQEKAKILSKRRAVGSRHSAFTGSFTVKGLKAVNKENDMIVQRIIEDPNSVNHLTERKVRRKVNRKECHIDKTQSTHLSSEEVRCKLKKFYETFMPTAFSTLLRNAKEPAFGSRTMSNRNSDVHYFLAMQLGLEYCRLAKMPYQSVCDIVSKATFHHVQTNIIENLEQMSVNKTEAKALGTKVQYAIAAFKDLVLCLNHFTTTTEGDTLEEVKELANELLKLEEYRDTGFDILKKFSPAVMSKQILRDLAVFIHFYMRIMERSFKEGALRVVSKRQKVHRRRQKKKEAILKENENARSVDTLSDGELLTTWEIDVCDQLSELLNGYGSPNRDVAVIDSLLKVTSEQEMSFAMLLIQRQLREGNIPEALGLYQAARELWPEGMFGSDDLTPEEEFNELHEVFFSDFAVIAKEYAEEREKVYGSEAFVQGETAADYMEGQYSEEEEERDQYTTKEVNFDFEEYVMKFSRPEVLKWYSILFADYERNPEDVNKCLLKMMHRIAFDHSQPSRLYHVSIFQTLLKLKQEFKGLSNSDIKKHKHFQLYEFGFHLLKKFFKCFAERGGKLIPELLFWKTSSEVFDIENGYGAYEKDRATKGVLWHEELEEEFEKLHAEFMSFEDKPTGMDVADFIEHNLSEPRNRKQIIKHIKKLNLGVGDLRITKRLTTAPKKNRKQIKRHRMNTVEYQQADIRRRLAALGEIPEDDGGEARAASPELDFSDFSEIESEDDDDVPPANDNDGVPPVNDDDDVQPANDDDGMPSANVFEKRKIAEIDSDDDNDVPSANVFEKRKVAEIESDDEDGKPSANVFEKRKVAEIESDDEDGKPSANVFEKRKITEIESDEDMPAGNIAKRRRVVLSDDESDN